MKQWLACDVDGAAGRTRRSAAGTGLSLSVHAVAGTLLVFFPLFAPAELPAPAPPPVPTFDPPRMTFVQTRTGLGGGPTRRPMHLPSAGAPPTRATPATLGPPVLDALALDEGIEDSFAVGWDCGAFCDLEPGHSGTFGPAGGAGGDSPPAPAQPLRARDVRPPVKQIHVDPDYPEFARQAHIEGTVVIECVIDPGGRVAEARVLRGPSVLASAALEAVRLWRYMPATLGGTPVAVAMTVDVIFTLDRP